MTPESTPATEHRISGRLENRTLREQVYEVLREDILAGRLGPGADLSEVALANRLGVSRGPVREAIGRLSAEGLVTIQPRRGAYVSGLTREEFLDAYQVREALESLAARLAVPRLSSEGLAELESLEDQMREATRENDVQRFFEANHEFHLRLVAHSGNGRLVEIHAQLLERMGRYMARSLSLRGNLERSLEEHQEILDSLRDGDADRAAAAVSAHIHVPQLLIALDGQDIFESAN